MLLTSPSSSSDGFLFLFHFFPLSKILKEKKRQNKIKKKTNKNNGDSRYTDRRTRTAAVGRNGGLIKTDLIRDFNRNAIAFIRLLRRFSFFLFQLGTCWSSLKQQLAAPGRLSNSYDSIEHLQEVYSTLLILACRVERVQLRFVLSPFH